MKLAYMYATPEVGDHKVTGIQGNLADTLRAIGAEGYTGVEFLVRDPSVLDHGELQAAVAGSGLDVPAICTGEVYGEDGLSFADPDADCRRTAIARMKAALQLGSRFGAPVNVGRLRGRFRDDVPRQQTLDWIREAILECCDAHPEGRILIEPVNHEYANCLLGTQDTLDFLAGLQCPNAGIMLDVVHMLVEAEDVPESLSASRDRLGHFHVSDSQRLPVGMGDYDIPSIMDAVAASDYDGYVTVETFQVPDGPSSLATSYKTLAPWFGGRA